MFNTFAGAGARAFVGHWNSETRAGLFRVIIEGQVPDLGPGYCLKHLVRSLAYVFALDEPVLRRVVRHVRSHRRRHPDSQKLQVQAE